VATQQLAASLIHCTALTALDLSYGDMSYRGSHILSAVALMVPLTYVRLCGNSAIGTIGACIYLSAICNPACISLQCQERRAKIAA
jgi:hypothetical protein